MDMEEDLSKLYERCMDNLLKWLVAAVEFTAGVQEFNKQSLDAAAEEARNPMTTSAPIYLEGFYESVYNASWHHVVEIPGGEGTGMEVKEGKPKQQWTYKKVGGTLEEDDGVRQSSEAPPRLMVLTSEKGWPHSWNAPHRAGNYFFINSEVDRVWQTIRNDLTKWFSNFDLTLNPSPLFCVLIGTPGIGKSMNAGSYILYQLLHYDVEKLQVVVHCFGGRDVYVFDKTAKTVTKYKGNATSKSVLYGLRQRGMKGYIIYDVAKKGTPPDTGFAPSSGWGMIVVSSPNLDNYEEWEKQAKASRIIMNCHAKMVVKAMCAWITRDETKKKQTEYWKMVKKTHAKSGADSTSHL
ncbi:retrotransposon hot spot (RHS) protein [Trypanosoma cruzi Dm28c]|uniref:Retrotransposon hot spot (RHS) protein n=1 Tax=Trypanosoma cruzi Dm28c TaxID=1416333 RepID=V5BAL4_TRYCR|nr:retrotransposon hot spot (RHS) protein [Trypanosoma cruzi Dm28c]